MNKLDFFRDFRSLVTPRHFDLLPVCSSSIPHYDFRAVDAYLQYDRQKRVRRQLRYTRIRPIDCYARPSCAKWNLHSVRFRYTFPANGTFRPCQRALINAAITANLLRRLSEKRTLAHILAHAYTRAHSYSHAGALVKAIATTSLPAHHRLCK